MAQTDKHGGQQIELAQWANLLKSFIETTKIFGILYVLPVYNPHSLLSNTSNTENIYRHNRVMVPGFLFAFFI